MKYLVNGREYEINERTIRKAISGVAPKAFGERGRYYIEVNGQQYPVKQVIHLATGENLSDFHTDLARQILQSEKFQVHCFGGEVRELKAGYYTAKPIKFIITLERDEDGFIIASCPVFHGCHSQGRTKEEALANISEAIRGYISSLRKHGEPIPSVEEVTQIEVAA